MRLDHIYDKEGTLMQERIQKILAARGVGSRRYCEELIVAGRVTLNGMVATLGGTADSETDELAVDGAVIPASTPLTYILLHKPRGYVTTASDEQGRKTVLDLVADCPVRVYPVGRLDMYSEGLLLLTNDGELTNRLTHPRFGHEKEYLAWVRGNTAQALPMLRSNQTIDGISMNGARVRIAGEGLLSMTISEGKNRQIRRMCEHAGLTVTRLKRVRLGALKLGELPIGTWRHLTASEVVALQR